MLTLESRHCMYGYVKEWVKSNKTKTARHNRTEPHCGSVVRGKPTGQPWTGPEIQGPGQIVIRGPGQRSGDRAAAIDA